MKEMMFGAAAILAAAAPGFASAEAIGSLGVAYGSQDQDNDPSKDDLLAIEGVVALDAGGYDFQLGVGNFDAKFDDHSHNYGAVDAHIGRSGDTYAFGVFGGALNLSGDVAYGVGLEGAWYVGNFTVGGDVSYASTRGDPAYDMSSAFVNGAYYFSPNLAARGEVGWIDTEWMGSESIAYAVGLEYLFTSLPISISGEYLATDADFTGGGSQETTGWQLGVAYQFGGADLMARDRAGPSQGGFVDIARYNALLD